jgi:hypothetical protein
MRPGRAIDAVARAALPRRAVLAAGALGLLWPGAASAEDFDHRHAAWTTLLNKHVLLLDGGKASQLHYAGMAVDRTALRAYLAKLSALPRAAFASFTRAQQMAFLINAYNAFTIELVLTRYPKLSSIKDLGHLLQTPWKQTFIPLLGELLSLDGIEQDMLRKRGRYDDPRIHFAVNCASIGCPPLREEAFVADRLEAQMDAQAQRFLSDRSRNRWNAASAKLELSKIFDWYGEDFRLGHLGMHSVAAFVARHADALADAPAARERIRSEQASMVYLDYDWRLNDAP